MTATARLSSTGAQARLPRFSALGLLVVGWVIAGIAFAILQAANSSPDYNLVGALAVGTVIWAGLLYIVALLVEGSRKAVDRLMTALVTTAFVIALLPLLSLVSTAVINGLARFDPLFFSSSMRNVVGEGGGAVHAIWGTLLITGAAAVISVPIGLFTSIYLVEYGKGRLAKAITFLVDVMTGIPSIVAGLFAFAFFSLILGDPGIRFGLGGAIALSVLMIPVVVRSSEEMLKLVPNELREASYALGVPKWLTIAKVVLPTAVAGIVTGVMLSISRIIGETAPLLLIAGFTQSLNTNIFDGRMMTLPVFVYNQYAVPGSDVASYIDRAWAGALTLILIVMALNLTARIIARVFSPKIAR